MRSRMKLFVVLVVAVFATSLWVGLGSGLARSNTTTLRMTVIVNIPTFKAGFDEVIRRFEASQGDIKVELTTLPSTQYDQVLRTQLIANQAPDIFQVVTGSALFAGVTPLAKAGRLVDLSNRPWASQIPQLLKPFAQYNGKTYTWWMDYSALLGYYNTDLFAELGLKPPSGHLVDDLEQLRRALSCHCGNVENRREVQELQLVAQVFIEFLGGVFALILHQIPLVGGDNHAAAGVFRCAGDGAVLIGRALRRINHQHDDIGALDRATAKQHADRFDLRLRDLARLANTRRINNAERPPMPLQQRVDRIARRPRHFRDDHAILAQQPVHE